jgi:Tol biopolymer transport system component
VLDALSWSRDGKRIAFAAPAGVLPGLFQVSVADRSISRLPTPSGAHSPAWSPDGRMMAFLQITPGEPVQLRLMDAEGRPQPPLDTGGAGFNNGLIAWCADGRRLAVAALPGALDASVWVVDSQGKEPARKIASFPTNTRIRGIAPARDGASVIVGRYQASSDIVLFTSR